MFDELANNYDYNIHTHFLLNGNTIRADYTQRCINAVEDIATAKYVFIDEGSNALSAMPLRPETKIIQLWHGCGAFKSSVSLQPIWFSAKAEKNSCAIRSTKTIRLSPSARPRLHGLIMRLWISTKKRCCSGNRLKQNRYFYDNEFLDSARRHLYEVVPQAKGKRSFCMLRHSAAELQRQRRRTCSMSKCFMRHSATSMFFFSNTIRM